MKAYSLDLRERVAAACAEPGVKRHQVAARFAVSLSFTDKLLRRQRTSGSVAELPRHPGPAPRLDAAGDQHLLACLAAQPDATLAEIGQALAAAGGPALRRTAVWQAVKRLGWGRKKKASTPPSATPNGS
jgi:transposase